MVGAGLNIASYTEGLGHLFGGVCPPLECGYLFLGILSQK